MEGSPDAAVKHSEKALEYGISFLSNLLKGTLLLGWRLVSISRQKADEHIPQLKSLLKDTIEKSKTDLLPHAKKGVHFVVDNTKEHVLPFLMTSAEFSMATVKEHPWISASVALLVLFYYLSKPGGSPGKMMKAPGSGYKMRRSKFEDNPKAYFRNLRGK